MTNEQRRVLDTVPLLELKSYYNSRLATERRQTNGPTRTCGHREYMDGCATCERADGNGRRAAWKLLRDAGVTYNETQLKRYFRDQIRAWNELDNPPFDLVGFVSNRMDTPRRAVHAAMKYYGYLTQDGAAK